MSSEALKTLKVFYSYSHNEQDDKFKNELVTNLSIFRRLGLIEEWHDRDILAGEDWREEINAHLEAADIILLLVSPDFISSDYCFCKEAEHAMRKYDAKTARVIPIMLRLTALWEQTIFGKLQTLPKDGKPISQWKKKDLAWTDVAQGIYKVIQELRANKSAIPVQSTSTVFEAFPFKGRTRIIYTCRSSFEDQHFVCPDSRVPTPLAKSRTLPGHVPVDEYETLGLTMFWYGENILENEEQNKDAIICSLTASNSLFNDDPGVCWIPTSQGDIDERLLDNLIVIGENKFSTLLYHRLCHLLPWRHIVLGVTNIALPGYQPIRRRDYPKAKYLVEMSFRANSRNKLSHDLHTSTLSNKQFWGLITFAPNPFNPEKWILFIIGASRPGQYLLLAWLKSQEAKQIFSEIVKYREGNYFSPNMIQIVVMGEPKHGNPPQRGEITRDWSTQVINNIYEPEKPRPFFLNVPVKYAKTDWDGPIVDLSLLATIPDNDNVIEEVKKTMPKYLLDFSFKQKKPKDGIGLHITLYEFLNSLDTVEDNGLVDALLKNKIGFIDKLKEQLHKIPHIYFVARQVRITSTSLQVLIDTYFQCEEYENLLRDKPVHERYINPMDILEDACVLAVKNSGIPLNYVGRLNVMAVPFPLHITLARFSPETPKTVRSAAENWATDNCRRIWGKLSKCSIYLTKANRFPFNDVSCELIK